MDKQLVDQICEDMRSRMQAIKDDDYEIDVFVKDGKQYLILTADAFNKDFERKLP